MTLMFGGYDMKTIIKPQKISKDMRKIFSISWPVMASIILQNLLSSVDMIFIGRLGREQLAAAALSTSVCGVIFILSSLVSSGTVALISRSFGEGNFNLVRKYNNASIVLSAVIGGSLSIISYIYTIPIIKLMFNPNKNVLNYSNQYLSILFLSTFLVFLNSTLRTTIQSLGDTKSPLIIFGISNVINAVLSPLFIFTLN